MHGTIAAFTTNVACIPTAYSIKFSNLFQSLGYPYIVDMTKLTKKEALAKCVEYITNHRELKKQIAICKIEYDVYVDKIYSLFENSLFN